MAGIGLAVVIAAIGLGGLVWKWRQGAASIVLAAIPIALLFVVLPIPFGAYGMIGGFQRISESGTAGIVQVARFSDAISRSLLFGCVGFIIVMAVAAALQAFGGTEEPDPALEGIVDASDSQVPTAPARVAEKVILVATSLFVLPSAAVISLAAGTPRLVMYIATQLKDVTESPPSLDGRTLGETSALISNQLVSGVLAGSVLSVMLLIAGAASVIVLRSSQPPRWLILYSWALCVICIVLAVLGAIQLNADVRSFGEALR
jgi:hypothetical protein